MCSWLTTSPPISPRHTREHVLHGVGNPVRAAAELPERVVPRHGSGAGGPEGTAAQHTDKCMAAALHAAAAGRLCVSDPNVRNTVEDHARVYRTIVVGMVQTPLFPIQLLASCSQACAPSVSMLNMNGCCGICPFDLLRYICSQACM